MGVEVYPKQSIFRSDEIIPTLYVYHSIVSMTVSMNSFYELNTLTLKLNEIITTGNIPMRNHGCGMISFNIK